jgi:hypothetical protein
MEVPFVMSASACMQSITLSTDNSKEYGGGSSYVPTHKFKTIEKPIHENIKNNTINSGHKIKNAL